MPDTGSVVEEAALPSVFPTCPSGMKPVMWSQYSDGLVLVCGYDGFAVVARHGDTELTATKLAFTPGGCEIWFTDGSTIRLSLGGAWASRTEGNDSSQRQASASWAYDTGQVKFGALPKKAACPAGTWPIALSTWNDGWLLICGTAAAKPTALSWSDPVAGDAEAESVALDGSEYCGKGSGFTVCASAGQSAVRFTPTTGTAFQRQSAGSYFEGTGRGAGGAGIGIGGGKGLADMRLRTYQTLPAATLKQLPLGAVPAITMEGAPASQSITKWAADVAAGNTDALIKKCWTLPAEEIRDRYASSQARGAILQALATPGHGAQGGVFWKGDEVTVSVWTDEYDSAYACPEVQLGGIIDDISPARASLMLQRIVAREDGTIAHTTDTAANYVLICGSDPGYWCDLDEDGTWEAPGGASGFSPDQWKAIRALAATDLTVTRVPDVAGPQSATTYAVSAVSRNPAWVAYVQMPDTSRCLGDVKPG
jgi:hypothetical protein